MFGIVNEQYNNDCPLCDKDIEECKCPPDAYLDE